MKGIIRGSGYKCQIHFRMEVMEAIQNSDTKRGRAEDWQVQNLKVLFPFYWNFPCFVARWLEYMWNLTSSSSQSSSKMRWTFSRVYMFTKEYSLSYFGSTKRTVGWIPWQGPAKMIKPNWLLLFSAAYFQHSAKNLIFIHSCSPNFRLEPAHLSFWLIPHCQNWITCYCIYLFYWTAMLLRVWHFEGITKEKHHCRFRSQYFQCSLTVMF